MADVSCWGDERVKHRSPLGRRAQKSVQEDERRHAVASLTAASICTIQLAGLLAIGLDFNKAGMGRRAGLTVHISKLGRRPGQCIVEPKHSCGVAKVTAVRRGKKTFERS